MEVSIIWGDMESGPYCCQRARCHETLQQNGRTLGRRLGKTFQDKGLLVTSTKMSTWALWMNRQNFLLFQRNRCRNDCQDKSWQASEKFLLALAGDNTMLSLTVWWAKYLCGYWIRHSPCKALKLAGAAYPGKVTFFIYYFLLPSLHFVDLAGHLL